LIASRPYALDLASSSTRKSLACMESGMSPIRRGTACRLCLLELAQVTHRRPVNEPFVAESSDSSILPAPLRNSV